MTKAFTLVVALPPSGQQNTFCQDFFRFKNFYLFQTFRFEEPLLGLSHCQPQAQQRW